MSPINYRPLNQVDPEHLLSLLNKKKLRAHLVNHQFFDKASLELWLNEKIKMDATDGCRLRAIVAEGQCVGWCGIQQDGEKYEIAIVLDDSHWGLGRKIFRDLMAWAKELGHQTIFIHFLRTRPQYKFLQKMAIRVYESEIMGSTFTTYALAVE